MLSDIDIKKRVEEDKMISPFQDEQKKKDDFGNPIVSYGLSSYGYDTRVADEFKIFKMSSEDIVDPKSFNHTIYESQKADVCIIPKNGFMLARTVEYFKIPRDIIAICLGKSTYARCGIIINVTPLEPEWEGHVTLEFSNTTPLPAKLYANEGACQMIFLKADSICKQSYKDRLGKYMNQIGITLPKI